MNREVEEAIDAMSPAELSALEGELNKRAADAEITRLFDIGRKMAKDAVSEYEKAGHAPPVFALLEKAAGVKAAQDQVSAELDKMSSEELTALEADLDKAAHEKLSEQYAAEYFKLGQEFAREYVEGLKSDEKTAGRVAAGGMFKQLGTMFAASAKKNPIATAVGTALVGAPLVRGVGRMMTGDNR
jgi:hypothetical protein